MPQLAPAHHLNVGTLNYNGIEFPSNMETEISGSMKYDSADRTVSYIVWRIEVKATISASESPTNNLDATMDLVRRALTTAGGTLFLNGKGFGNLDVNVGSTGKRDVLWGPKPRLLRWKPLGKNAAEIVWVCEVAIPECSNARYTGLAEFTYSWSVSIDPEGYSTLTYAGQLVIAQTRVGGRRTLYDTADSWRERIMPPTPVGFRPGQRQFDVDESKNRLTWTLTYEEMPVPLPEGFTQAKFSHSITSVGKNLFMFTSVMTGEYHFARFTQRGAAYKLFLETVVARKNKCKGQVFPIFWKGEEPDAYGRPRAIYTIGLTAAFSVGNHLKESGLWQPMPTSDTKWKASLLNTLGPRGVADLRLRPQDDIILDLCANSYTPPVLRPKPPPKPQPPRGEEEELKTIFPCPKPEDSWFYFVNDFRVEGEANNVVLKPLPLKVAKVQLPAQTSSTLSTTPQQTAKDPPTVSQLVNIQAGAKIDADIVQQRTAPSVRIVLLGSALRVCYEIQPPELELDPTATGLELVPDGTWFSQKQVANVAHPVYLAFWRKEYIVKQITSSTLVTQANIGAGF